MQVLPATPTAGKTIPFCTQLLGKEKCVNLLTPAHGEKKEFLSSTISEPIQHMAVFSMCKLVRTDLGWGFLFILNCLDLIPLQSLRESDETTKTFKCLRDIRPAEKTDRKLLGPALHFPP